MNARARLHRWSRRMVVLDNGDLLSYTLLQLLVGSIFGCGVTLFLLELLGHI